MYRGILSPRAFIVLFCLSLLFIAMLQRAFDNIVVRFAMFDALRAFFEQFEQLPHYIEVDRHDGNYYDTGLMGLVLSNIHRLAHNLNTLMTMLNGANDFFDTALHAQIQENSMQRLFTRLCARSDGWERFMSSGFVTTMNYPLAQYQIIATSLEEQTTFLQVNCRLLEEHLNTVRTLLASPWIDDPVAINTARGLLVDMEQISVLLTPQYREYRTTRDSVRRMAVVLTRPHGRR